MNFQLFNWKKGEVKRTTNRRRTIKNNSGKCTRSNQFHNRVLCKDEIDSEKYLQEFYERFIRKKESYNEYREQSEGDPTSQWLKRRKPLMTLESRDCFYSKCHKKRRRGRNK